MLRQNALYGTGAGSGDGIHVNAGKTGTTENHADAWFDGYTRQLTTVVWMGYPKGEIPMLDVHGEAVAGATFPVPIWHEYMAAALWRHKVLGFELPNQVPDLALPDRAAATAASVVLPDDDAPRRRPTTTTTTSTAARELVRRRPLRRSRPRTRRRSAPPHATRDHPAAADDDGAVVTDDDHVAAALPWPSPVARSPRAR